MLALTVLVCLASSSTILAISVTDKPYYQLENAENLFKDFVKQYKKEYNSKEYLERLDIFKKNLIEINSQNAKYPRTVFKVNYYADRTHEEQQQYFGARPLKDTRVKRIIPDSSTPAPDKLDWRDKNVVTHVKNQGYCPNSYVFSAIGNIEGQYALKHNQSLALAESQIVDCLECVKACTSDPIDVHVFMQELTKRPGLMKEEDYRYVPWKLRCVEDPKKVVAHVLGGDEIHIPNEDVLKQKLADIGPLAVGLHGSDMIFYHKGILHPDKCINHAWVLYLALVGYGEENGEKFWILKNAQGKDWGEQGYVRLLRGVNACKMGTLFTASTTVA